jgi:hypothetical protein
VPDIGRMDAGGNQEAIFTGLLRAGTELSSNTPECARLRSQGGHKAILRSVWLRSFAEPELRGNPFPTGLLGWCREGESIPTIFKGIVKIPPILAKCNIDAGLGAVIPVNPQARAGQFPVIWGDFGRRFTRKS